MASVSPLPVNNDMSSLLFMSLLNKQGSNNSSNLIEMLLFMLLPEIKKFIEYISKNFSETLSNNFKELVTKRFSDYVRSKMSISKRYPFRTTMTKELDYYIANNVEIDDALFIASDSGITQVVLANKTSIINVDNFAVTKLSEIEYTIEGNSHAETKAFLEKVRKMYGEYKITSEIKGVTGYRKYFSIYYHLSKKESGIIETIMYDPGRILLNYKTLNSVFIPDKQKFIDQINDFSNKKGMYAIEGVHHKLGILLHGVPGTGKTSLIKALSCSLNRHIITIPLSIIKTNKEFYNIIYNATRQLDTGTKIEICFKDVIYVIEDIDCISSDIVKKRSDSPVCQNFDKELNDFINDGEFSDSDEEIADSSKSVLQSKKTIIKNFIKKKKSKASNIPDKLDLAGILNTLDGITDCSDRIIIFTTNHPEKLDPALIRPGRVDLIIHLTYICKGVAREMIQHFFKDEDLSMYTFDIFDRIQMSPATLEQLIIKSRKLGQFIEELDKFDICQKS